MRRGPGDDTVTLAITTAACAPAAAGAADDGGAAQRSRTRLPMVGSSDQVR